MFLNIYLAAFVFLYIAAYCFYVKISHGLGHKAEYLQLRRFLPCTALAVLPAALAGIPLTSGLYISSLLVGLAWIVTYPTLYYFSNRKISSDFGFHLDFVFGLYLISWLTSLKILVLTSNIIPVFFLTVISLVEFILFFIPFSQWCYYYTYGACIDINGITLIQDTHYNEIIEFIRSFSKKTIFFVVCSAGIILFSILFLNLSSLELLISPSDNISLLIIIATCIFLTFYLWKRYLWKNNRGVFVRTGIIELYLDVKKYMENSKLYTKNMEERIKKLSVTPTKPVFGKPSTIVLVIGESASRDYMSAFVDYPYDSTPWLHSKKNDEHFILFPNSYASIIHTVPALERALTECNQYNDKEFYASISIIDIARKAGYQTYWYSNQGHLGSADTPVTLLAETSDTAKWTKQRLNTVQYDGSLLEYIKEVNPQENNFVIIHLKGSHFNFINRYPREFTKWGKPGKYDLILNYLNSLAYTDHVIEKIYNYATEKLNLQALLYFSDHATRPDKRRSPNFDGFATVRIPMFACFSDEYIEKNKSVYETLKLHKDYYFTNDLVYELLCSIFGISSNHFDETNSLASPKYRYTREMLKTNLGKLSIKDDTTSN
ncbi:MAG: phosphoethanolamine transferase [Phascolarctobacterium sp.]|nr:phosphoethanolamine transferase [Phascolarctobacterium sp.]